MCFPPASWPPGARDLALCAGAWILVALPAALTHGFHLHGEDPGEGVRTHLDTGLDAGLVVSGGVALTGS